MSDRHWNQTSCCLSFLLIIVLCLVALWLYYTANRFIVVNLNVNMQSEQFPWQAGKEWLRSPSRG